MNKKLNNIIIIIIAIIFICYFVNSFITIEKFTNSKNNLTPGIFPESVSKPILTGFYPLQKVLPGEGISNNNSYDNSLLYPIFPAAHCGTNNLRNWKIPDNGLCSRAEMCETLYNDKKIQKQTLSPPLLNGGVRVNYFNSKVSLPI